MIMKKTNEIDIVCVLSDTLTLGLSGVRENMGHDDSLPYQASIFLFDKENNPEGSCAFEKIGDIWNDGWGGESNLDMSQRKRHQELIKKITELVLEHQMYWHDKPFAPYSFTDLCDIMAERYLSVNEKARKNTILYRFDDDPVVIANKGRNLYKF